jgi:hypothetical protein
MKYPGLGKDSGLFVILNEVKNPAGGAQRERGTGIALDSSLRSE